MKYETEPAPSRTVPGEWLASCRSRLLRRLLCATLVAVLHRSAAAELIVEAQAVEVVTPALQTLQTTADACGQPLQIAALLEELDQCPGRRFEICADSEIGRNVFDRQTGVISWNPSLRTELEEGCDGDVTEPVYRDPTASLLHEIVHAVQDCRGINPGEHEVEAVAIENLYRRASGLCQRSRYGDDPLPPEAWSACTPVGNACATPQTPAVSWTSAQALPSHSPHQSGDQPN